MEIVDSYLLWHILSNIEIISLHASLPRYYQIFALFKFGFVIDCFAAAGIGMHTDISLIFNNISIFIAVQANQFIYSLIFFALRNNTPSTTI